MDSKKIALLIFVVAIVGVVALIAIGAASDDSNNKNAVTYNYELTRTSSIPLSDSYVSDTSSPDTGMVYVVADITLKNNDAKYTVSTNPFNFSLNVNNIVYSHDLDTYSYKGYKDSVNLAKGGQFSFSLIFQVPAGTTEASLIYDDIFNPVSIDKSLEVVKSL